MPATLLQPERIQPYGLPNYDQARSPEEVLASLVQLVNDQGPVLPMVQRHVTQSEGSAWSWFTPTSGQPTSSLSTHAVPRAPETIAPAPVLRSRTERAIGRAAVTYAMPERAQRTGQMGATSYQKLCELNGPHKPEKLWEQIDSRPVEIRSHRRVGKLKRAALGIGAIVAGTSLIAYGWLDKLAMTAQ